MSIKPADLRQHYDRAVLLEDDAGTDPFDLFDTWFQEALAGELVEANAMSLATVDAAGQPSVRAVLLKDFDRRGFSFYTNKESRKAGELAGNPLAALLFWWDRLHRQVRIEGRVEGVADEEADAYFASRPYGSRIGAWASPQSRVVPSRGPLEEAVRELESRHPETVPRPPHWGGYRVVPHSIEFWQGRPSRLHDRLRYRLEQGNWRRERLAP